MLALMTWGNKHFAPEGLSIYLADERDGHQVDPVLTDRQTGEVITREHHVVRAGPVATDRLRARLDRYAQMRVAGSLP